MLRLGISLKTEKGGRLSILYLRCQQALPIGSAGHQLLRPFNSLFEMPPDSIGRCIYTNSLSILYLRCLVGTCIRRGSLPLLTFNSLFEMPKTVWTWNVVPPHVLSILYLRCGVVQTSTRRTTQAFQFSIWDASNTSISDVLPEPLFQFSIWDAQYLHYIQTRAPWRLSILYLRCTIRRLAVPQGAEKDLLSILYLRCLGLSRVCASWWFVNFQFSIWDASICRTSVGLSNSG